MLWNHSPVSSCTRSISRSGQIYTHVSIINSAETWYMFSISQLGAIYAKDLLAWKDKFTLETRTHSSAILFLQAF